MWTASTKYKRILTYMLSYVSDEAVGFVFVSCIVRINLIVTKKWCQSIFVTLQNVWIFTYKGSKLQECAFMYLY